MLIRDRWRLLMCSQSTTKQRSGQTTDPIYPQRPTWA